MSKSIERIKSHIKKCVGMHCMVIAKQGRKTILFENCIIEAVYPDIFLISHTNEKNTRKKSMTFSYSEVLTKKVLLSVTNEKSDEKGA